MSNISLPRPIRSAAALALAAALLIPGSALAETFAVEIRDFAFVPSSEAVATGDTVTWTNFDSVEHNVHFVNGPASPLLADGESYARTFTEPGTYAYFCDPHPNMTGEIVVTGSGGGPGETPGTTPGTTPDTTPNTATAATTSSGGTDVVLPLLVAAVIGLLAAPRRRSPAA